MLCHGLCHDFPHSIPKYTKYTLYTNLPTSSSNPISPSTFSASYSVCHSPLKPHIEAKRSSSGRFSRWSPSASRVWKRKPMASRRSWLSCHGRRRWRSNQPSRPEKMEGIWKCLGCRPQCVRIVLNAPDIPCY